MKGSLTEKTGTLLIRERWSCLKSAFNNNNESDSILPGEEANAEPKKNIKVFRY